MSFSVESLQQQLHTFRMTETAKEPCVPLFGMTFVYRRFFMFPYRYMLELHREERSLRTISKQRKEEFK